MPPFRKANPSQAYLKIGIYGPPGSGKTFTSLLIAEGLARVVNKKIALVDTEHGSDFYCQAIKDRKIHPEAFEFDAIYTKSLMDTLESVQNINGEYNTVIIDSMTHLWESAT